MRVLLVEDDPDTIDLLEHALVHFGYDVTRAGNGLEALELTRSDHYPLVISDWEMPEMSGLELCREIRQKVSSSYTYFILLTMRSGTEYILDALHAEVRR